MVPIVYYSNNILLYGNCKIIDIFKLNGTLQNVPYCHVDVTIKIIIIRIILIFQIIINQPFCVFNINNFISYAEFLKPHNNFEGGVITPKPPSGCATGLRFNENILGLSSTVFIHHK